MPDWLDDFNADLASGAATAQPTRQAPAKQPTGEPDWLGDFSQDLQGDIQPAEPKKGKIGFVENIKRGGLSGFLDKATLGVKPLLDSAQLYGATLRMQNDRYSRSEGGWEAKQRDKKDILAYLEEQAEVAERGLEIGAKVGNIVGDMLPFMAEFILTGGASALGKKAVSRGVLKLITRATGKAAAGVVGRSTAQLAGWVTAAGIRTALTPHRSLKDFIDRRMPDIQISPEGQLIFQEAEESPFRSAYKAIGNQFIEMASEESGAFLGQIGGKITSKLLPKKALSALNKLKNAWVGAGAGRTAQEFAKKMSTKVGFNGVLEEFGEERLGALMRVVAGIDDGEGTTFEKIGRALYPGNEQAFVELIAFSVPGVARGVAAQAFERKTAYSRKEFKELTGREKSSLAERTEAFEADQAEVAPEVAEPEITAPAVAQEAVSDAEMQALLAEQAAIDAAEGVTDAERVAQEAGEVSPEERVERAEEGRVRVRDAGEVEEAAPEAVKPAKKVPRKKAVAAKVLEAEQIEKGAAVKVPKTAVDLVSEQPEGVIAKEGAKPLKQPRKVKAEKPVAAKKVPKKAAEVEAGFGAKNTVVTRAEFEKLKAEEKADKPLRGKRGKGLRKGQVRVFTPKDLVRAGKFAAFYFEGGLREFQAWSVKLIEIMGEPVRPHLEKLWAQAKKDVEAVEKPVKVPKKPKEGAPAKDLPTANISSEVDEAVGKVLSVKNLVMAEVRDDLGLGAVPSAQRKKQQTSVDNAIANSVPADALRIATEVQENPRQMTDEEEAGLLVRSVQLRDQYEGARKKIMATTNEAEKTLLNAEMNRIEAEFDIISLSLKTSGTEIARALAFRRNFIDEHYDILSIKTRAKAAKGKELTEAQTAKFEELVAKLDEANRNLDEANRKLAEITAEEFVDGAKKKRKKVKKPKADISRLSTRINELLAQGCI